ncbi:GspH/FimT family pseudopilin [Ramlibacter humi]|uniref:Type II secretion system protein H n=1 Tax=Ramlibacter humi TaxID=2530451 RepID=A0A4Z0CBQ7_9BURK|nr:GspH/FimT family pseudopilin [Ramlibacter humi]TFZ09043.1 prepilin-type N-terminal cleavage/methylation domain-containing protein [Ramlibacter humi]
MRRRALGFSLVEVMLAVAVLALILGLGFPSVAELIRNTQTRALAESLQNGVQKARAEALKRNRNVTFWLVTPAVGTPDATCTLSAASGSWVVSLDNPATKCNVAPSPTSDPRIVELQANRASNLTVAAADAGGNAVSSVTFNGFGLPVNTGSAPIGRINITHQQSGARQLRVEISAGGGVRMCDRDVGSTDTRACATTF